PAPSTRQTEKDSNAAAKSTVPRTAQRIALRVAWRRMARGRLRCRRVCRPPDKGAANSCEPPLRAVRPIGRHANALLPVVRVMSAIVSGGAPIASLRCCLAKYDGNQGVGWAQSVAYKEGVRRKES